ncbi:damage-control phosphatase ARMT1 family protein [Saccharicrinis aurantiacus]|uniref:damage-control phosphatase ARMT1 family protein n=1 Tax=Saccharicrinis aurantiacus TaxID=1849719 RepID=UPI000838834D|nr:damage-control phosphatase ARMT1 family protein [Saccharicrinis aurantiacus]
MSTLISTNNKLSFAHFTLVNRIPQIVEQVINYYDLPSNSALGLFIKSISNGPIVPIESYNSCPNQRSIYIGAINEELSANNYSWDNAPFLFLENYLYHKLAELAFKDEIKGDYFANTKNAAVDNSMPTMLATYSEYNNICKLPKLKSLPLLLQLNLMGNKADLSQSTDTYSQKQQHHILINKSQNIVDQLPNLKQVDIILDNSGEELFADLLLAHCLLTTANTKKVVLHFKTMPYFVSDAQISDYDYLINSLKRNSGLSQFASEIEMLVNNNKLILTNDEFWSSGLLFREMPKALSQELSKSDLLVFKGDLNYRKLVDDRMWDCLTPTDDLINYLPTDALILRVLKSEVIVGLKEKDIPSKEDNQWKYNGEYSIIDFVKVNTDNNSE